MHGRKWENASKFKVPTANIDSERLQHCQWPRIGTLAWELRQALSLISSFLFVSSFLAVSRFYRSCQVALGGAGASDEASPAFRGRSGSSGSLFYSKSAKMHLGVQLNETTSEVHWLHALPESCNTTDLFRWRPVAAPVRLTPWPQASLITEHVWVQCGHAGRLNPGFIVSVRVNCQKRIWLEVSKISEKTAKSHKFPMHLSSHPACKEHVNNFINYQIAKIVMWRALVLPSSCLSVQPAFLVLDKLTLIGIIFIFLVIFRIALVGVLSASRLRAISWESNHNITRSTTLKLEDL